jgi:hypothetical protein
MGRLCVSQSTGSNAIATSIIMRRLLPFPKRNWSWNPRIWHAIKARGIFVGDAGESSTAQMPPVRGFAIGLTRLLRTLLINRMRQI